MYYIQGQVNQTSNRAIEDSLFTLGESKNDNEKVDKTKEKVAQKEPLLVGILDF